MILENLKQVAEKNVKQTANDVLDLVLVPAIEAAVAKTATPIDDMVVASIKSKALEEAKKLIEQIKF
jgi:hypothetical protein